MANNSKKSLEQIASNNYLIDLQKLTRVVHLYDLSFVETHINCFDLTKTDELEFVFNCVEKISRISESYAFQYYPNSIKPSIETDFFRLKEYMTLVINNVSSERLQVIEGVIDELSAE